MIRRLVAGTAVAAGLVLGLTGCLGETKDKAGAVGDGIKANAIQLLGRAADRTGQADTFTADLTVDSRLRQGALKTHMVVRTRLRPDVAMRVHVDSMSVAGQTIPAYETRLVGGTMYLNMPAMSAANGGKPWLRVDLSGLDGAMGGLDLDKLLDQARQQSPAEQTRMFTASKDVREVGTETIDGVRTRHFTGTVSPREALAKLDPQNRKAMEELYTTIGGETVAFDLWVGDDDLPRKLISKLETSMGPVTTTALFRDYGKPVEVTAPPASEVGDVKVGTPPTAPGGS